MTEQVSTPGTELKVHLEFTPNPNTLKFITNHFFLERGAANFPNREKAEGSPLAKSLFEIPGVHGVLIGPNFITVTKAPEGDWDTLADQVPKRLDTFVQQKEVAVSTEYLSSHAPGGAGSSSETEQRIREVLDEEIRPAVAMDGGDILFGKYEDGIVYLHLQGSCSACPSSVATLKMGVENRLKEVIPEIKGVVQI